MYINVEVRVADTYRRTFLILLDEVVNDGIFGPISHELGVVKVLRVNDRIDGKGLVQGDVFFPLDLFDLFINRVCIFGLEMIDRFQDTECRTE